MGVILRPSIYDKCGDSRKIMSADLIVMRYIVNAQSLLFSSKLMSMWQESMLKTYCTVIVRNM